MKKLYFDDYIEFCAYLIDKFAEVKDTSDDPDISIIAKYEDAKKIIKELCSYDCELMDVDIHDPDFEGYEDEYVISLSNIERENEIWCEPMKRKNGYLNIDSVMTFFFNNCSDTALEHCTDDIIYKVQVGDNHQKNPCTKSECKCNDTSTSVYISRNEDGTPTGFNTSWGTNEGGKSMYSSYSCYSSDVEQLRRIAEVFDIDL